MSDPSVVRLAAQKTCGVMATQISEDTFNHMKNSAAIKPIQTLPTL